jgi:hypothetical protein
MSSNHVTSHGNSTNHSPGTAQSKVIGISPPLSIPHTHQNATSREKASATRAATTTSEETVQLKGGKEKNRMNLALG